MKSSSSRVIIACCLLLFLVIGIVFFTSTKNKQPTISAANVTKPSVDGARDIDLEVDGGKIVSGSNEIKVQKGEQVYIHIQTQDEEPMEVYLEGYDIETELSKYDFGGFLFTADKVGKFNIELYSDGEDEESNRKIIGVVVVEN